VPPPLHPRTMPVRVGPSWGRQTLDMLGLGEGRVPQPGIFRPGSSHRRLIAIVVIVGIVLSLLVTRVALLQTAEAGDYRAAGLDQRETTVTLRADRGTIFDRDGTDLALSVPATSIYANPKLINDPVGTGRLLAQVLQMDADAEAALVQDLADRDRSFVYVSRLLDASMAEAVLGLDLVGIEGVTEPKRVNPAGSLGLGVVGSTDPYGVGKSGLELQYDEFLQGTDGSLVKELGNDGRSLPGGSRVITAARPGNDLVLTLDRSVQQQVEQALLLRVEDLIAQGGDAIVLDTRTGEIRALASVRRGDDGIARVTNGNLAAVESHQPGSVAKAFSLAAAIDLGAVEPRTTYVVPYRRIFNKDTIYEQEIEDAYQHPDMPMSIRDILVESSNIGTIMAAEQIGPEALHQYLSDFGFGEPTVLDFPGESGGSLRPPGEWFGLDRVSPSFGYGFSGTSLQTVAAMNTIANGGVYVAPKLVAGTMGRDGVVESTPESPTRTVLTAATSRAMTDMMTDVVCEGTGERAQIEGMSVAGKTGTAYKVQENGTYEGEGGDRAYFSSFVGYFPAADPQVTILVSIDEPDPTSQDRFGGAAAGPVFADLAQVAIRELDTVPTAGDTGCATPAG
jgi:cell division protein FtsI (penicillin-binding protein 3)